MPQLGDRAPISCPDSPLMLIGRTPGRDGSYGRASPGAPLPRATDDPSLWLPGQGRSNACGTTSLAAVLSYLLGDRAPSREALDARIRRGDIFSAPSLLAGVARSLGLAAQLYNDADLDQVLGLVDRGVPVLALLDTTPLDLQDTANLHWVVLVAQCGDRIGIYNPHGYQEELDREHFMANWRQARLFGLPAWRNLAIAIANDAVVLPPPTRPTLSSAGANLASEGVAGIVNAALSARERLAGPRIPAAAVAADAGRAAAGAGEALFGAGLLLAGALGAALRRG